jgi:hypothetical protein
MIAIASPDNARSWAPVFVAGKFATSRFESTMAQVSPSASETRHPETVRKRIRSACAVFSVVRALRKAGSSASFSHRSRAFSLCFRTPTHGLSRRHFLSTAKAIIFDRTAKALLVCTRVARPSPTQSCTSTLLISETRYLPKAGRMRLSISGDNRGQSEASDWSSDIVRSSAPNLKQAARTSPRLSLSQHARRPPSPAASALPQAWQPPASMNCHAVR